MTSVARGVNRIGGPNFSGRSHRLAQLIASSGEGRQRFYIGPYAESGVSGIADTVAEEVTLYSRGRDTALDGFWSSIQTLRTILARDAQRVAELSGGEQAMLALLCFHLSNRRALAIDTALEQLDDVNRSQVLHYLETLRETGRTCWLIDNRDVGTTPINDAVWLPGTNDFPLNLDPLIDIFPRRVAPRLELRGVSFAYDDSTPVLNSVSTTLEPGRAYRLHGPNGSGKTTFLKLLAGVVTPRRGEMYIDAERYVPRRDGNLILGWAMQDPDHQWLGTSAVDDFQIRVNACANRRYTRSLRSSDIHAWAGCVGVADEPRHILDLPKALRKRISWMWPLSGTLPWIALDEPTLGQDGQAAQQLADTLRQLLNTGVGVLFITHHQEFADSVPHDRLRFGSLTIVQEPHSAIERRPAAPADVASHVAHALPPRMQRRGTLE